LINDNRDKEYINIRICDKGIGMSKEQLENIFEPFYRTDKRKSREIGSCGLGLSIVQAILNTHEGEIRFESQLNEGTTAIIKLKNLQA
jgi:signal transduction histidine kinase